VYSSGLLDLVGRDHEHGPTINSSGGEDAFFGSIAGSIAAGGSGGRFGHADNIEHGFRLPAAGFRKAASY
jgi:hypothetical protein